MSLLSWMMLVFLLPVGTSSADVDVNWLTKIVYAIRKEYRITEQFCLAANIPLRQDPDELLEVLKNDRYDKNVKDKVNGFMVYESSNVVAAKHVENQHAELLVLKNLNELIKNREGRFLLIYSYLSPCGDKCTNPERKKCNILKYIEGKVIQNWEDYAFVFTTVFDRPKQGSLNISREKLITSLERLGESGLGLSHIFRCYKPTNLEFQCHSCSSHRKVSDVCVNNSAVPQEGGSSSSSSSSRSSSRSNMRSSSSSRSSRSNMRSSSRNMRSSSRSSRSRERDVGGSNTGSDKGGKRRRSKDSGSISTNRASYRSQSESSKRARRMSSSRSSSRSSRRSSSSNMRSSSRSSRSRERDVGGSNTGSDKGGKRRRSKDSGSISTNRARYQSQNESSKRARRMSSRRSSSSNRRR